MGNEIAKLFVTLGLSNKEFTGKLSEAQRDLTKFGKSALKIGTSMSALGAAIIVPMALSIKSFAENSEQIENMSQKTGLSIRSVQELGYAASLTGSSMDGLTVAFKSSQIAIAGAESGSAEAIKKFNALGISLDEIKGKSADEQFMTIAAAIADIPDPAQRAAAAVQFFGRSGTEMLPMLASGAEGLRKLRGEAVVMSDAQVRAGAKIQDSIERIQASFGGLKNSVISTAAPAVTGLIEKIIGVVLEIKKWTDANPELTGQLVLAAGAVSGVLAVAGPLLAVVGGLSLAFGAMAGPVGLLIAGISLLTAGGVMLWQSQQKAGEEIQQTTEKIKEQGDVAETNAKKIADSGNFITNSLKRAFGNIVVGEWGWMVPSEATLQTIAKTAVEFKKEEAAVKAATAAVQTATAAKVALATKVQDMIDKIRYANSEAGKFGITMEDIYNIMLKNGWSVESINAWYKQFGEETINVSEALQMMGLTAVQAAQAVDKLGSSYITAAEAARKLAIQEAENINFQNSLTRTAAQGALEARGAEASTMAFRIQGLMTSFKAGALTEEKYSELMSQYSREYESMISVPQPAPTPMQTPQEQVSDAMKLYGVYGYAAGGIVTRPTLTLVGESGPEAITPLGGAGLAGVGGTTNINIKPGLYGEREVGEIVRKIFNNLGRNNYTLAFR